MSLAPRVITKHKPRGGVSRAPQTIRHRGVGFTKTGRTTRSLSEAMGRAGRLGVVLEQVGPSKQLAKDKTYTAYRPTFLSPRKRKPGRRRSRLPSIGRPSRGYSLAGIGLRF